MVYFPRETISFSHSTVLSSAGFSSLFYHCYGSLCSLIAAPLSTVLMCLSTSAEPGPALLDNQDEAPSVTQDGFSAFDCLILHFLEGDSFPKLPASPLPLLLGWRGMQLYG